MLNANRERYYANRCLERYNKGKIKLKNMTTPIVKRRMRQLLIRIYSDYLFHKKNAHKATKS